MKMLKDHHTYASPSTLVSRARGFAMDRHRGQTWADGWDFSEHLRRVATLVRHWGPDCNQTELEQLEAAAWLHDVPEDTPTTLAELVREFGDRVAELVWLVTDETGGNRQERKTKTYRKTRMDNAAIFLKCCDRLVNANASKAGDRHFGMYQKEHAHFCQELRSAPMHEPLFAALDRILR